ncbi:hypothetical protein [Devosia sp. 2618]
MTDANLCWAVIIGRSIADAETTRIIQPATKDDRLIQNEFSASNAH